MLTLTRGSRPPPLAGGTGAAAPGFPDVACGGGGDVRPATSASRQPATSAGSRNLSIAATAPAATRDDAAANASAAPAASCPPDGAAALTPLPPLPNSRAALLSAAHSSCTGSRLGTEGGGTAVPPAPSSAEGGGASTRSVRARTLRPLASAITRWNTPSPSGGREEVAVVAAAGCFPGTRVGVVGRRKAEVMPAIRRVRRCRRSAAPSGPPEPAFSPLPPAPPPLLAARAMAA